MEIIDKKLLTGIEIGDLVRIGCKDLFIDRPLFFDGEKILAKDVEKFVKETFYGNSVWASPDFCYQIEVHENDEDKIISISHVEE